MSWGLLGLSALVVNWSRDSLWNSGSLGFPTTSLRAPLCLGLYFVVNILIFWLRPSVEYVLAMVMLAEGVSKALSNAGKRTRADRRGS